MSLKLLMDVHVPSEITDRLKLAGVDVLTSQDDLSAEFSDEELLDRSAALGRVLFTQDQDFLVIASQRQRLGSDFCGIFFARHDPAMIPTYAQWLETYAKLADDGDLKNQLVFLS